MNGDSLGGLSLACAMGILYQISPAMAFALLVFLVWELSRSKTK
jgi:hypothetical protein